MTGARDIPLAALAVFFVLPVIVAVVARSLHLKLGRRILLGVARMTLQLTLVGLYLEFLFRWNQPAVTVAYLLVMVSVAAGSAITHSRLRARRLLAPVTAAIAVPQGLLLVMFVLLAGGRDSLTEARYLIPLGGMLMGNALRGVVIGLSRYWGGIRENRRQYEFALALGAGRFRASLPYFVGALRESVSPTLATMTTIGLVSLPGMMTGQILGGADPSTAIKYQLAIMLAIFAAIFFSVLTAVAASIPVGFDGFDRPHMDLFRE